MSSMSENGRMILYCDGASRGNPGPASVGAALFREGEDEPRECISRAIGRATNNVAEYSSLIDGLKKALDIGCADIEIRMDSELAVKQIRGEYRVKNENLRPLYEEARALLERFKRWKIQHIPRNRNSLADRLANEALDGKPLS